MPVTVQGVKDRLVGLGPWLDAASNLPAPYTYGDAAITALIPAMTRDFERKTRVRTSPALCSTNPYDAGAAATAASLGIPLVEEDPYDYNGDMSSTYFRITLKQRPVQQVMRVALYIGATNVLSIPPAWLVLKKREGVLHTIPTMGALAINAGITAFAQLEMGFGVTDYLPSSLHVDYVAGLPTGWETIFEYADILRALTEHCALGVLNDVAHLADAGLSGLSASGGGTGQSLQYTRFSDRKQELESSVMAFVQQIKEQETPILFGVV